VLTPLQHSALQRTLQERKQHAGCAGIRSADSSVTAQCTTKTLQRAHNNMAAVSEDQSADSLQHCALQRNAGAQDKHGQLSRGSVLTSVQHSALKGRCKRKNSMGSCARGSERAPLQHSALQRLLQRAKQTWQLCQDQSADSSATRTAKNAKKP
jgi:hypothetical protein